VRIAFTHPVCLPEVRRGSETIMHYLSQAMAALGHEVTIISTTPGEPREEWDGPVRRVLLRRAHPPALLVRSGQASFFHLFARDLGNRLLQEPFDVVHCMAWHDALGVIAARRRGLRAALHLHLMGIPIRRYFRRTPLDGLLFVHALSGADRIFALSHFALDRLVREYGRQGMLLPGPVDTAPFMAAPKPAPDGTVRVLFAGDADEPRKGAVLLARAYAIARGRLGARARLGYVGRMSAPVRDHVLAALPAALHAEVDLHGVRGLDELPGILAAASMVVNPAIWEALGVVLVEALATGTPVIGCDHAGIPDIISDDAVGVLFPPGSLRGAATNAAGLADALLQGAALAADPATPAACRARAMAFSAAVIAPQYDALIRANCGMGGAC
jgi:phosphatidylinositol alpha-mannosyltransferase